MIKTYVIVTAGIVSNTIEIDDTDTNSITAFSAVTIPSGLGVGIGWLYDGINFSAPAPIPVLPATIKSVTMRQARLALLQSGLLTQVNGAIATMGGAAGDAARITWEFSSEVAKSNPLISQLATALGLTQKQLDDLFALAATL